MKNYKIKFTQTEEAFVDVEADSLEDAVKNAKKRITRIGYWTLDNEYVVDGELVKA